MTKLSERLRTKQCGDNEGCGTMTECACVKMDEAADLLDECEQALQEIADGETFDPQGVAVEMLSKLRGEKD